MRASFFPSGDPELEPEHEPPATPPWFQPPEDEYPARVLIREFLFQSPGTVVAVSHVDVHSAGLGISIDWELRRLSETRAAFMAAAHRGFGHLDADEPSGQRRFGVALADGTVATTVDQRPRDLFTSQPTPPTLMERGQGGGGSDRRHSGRSDLWLWPLPPAGPIELVGEWADRGMPESRLVLDGAALLACVGDIRMLWPEP